MNIVIIGPAYPLRGGIAHHTGQLACALQKSHAVRVITFKRQFPRLLFPGTSQEESAGELLRVESEQLLDSLNPFNWARVALNIRARRPDLLLVAYSLPFFGPCYGTVAAIVRWRRSTKVIFLCHNIVPHERRPGDRLFTRWAFAFADRFIVQSGEVEKDLRGFLPNARAALVRHPLYDLFGHPVLKEGARRALQVTAGRVLLFFGYIRPYKGLRVLLEALALLVGREEFSDLLLLVVGEFYEDEASYRAFITARNLGHHVQIVGEYVPQNRVAQYFSASDVVILPYRSATQSGIAQIAYNFNKPVIATTVGGLAEVVVEGKTGFLVPPDDPPALAEAIARFYREGRGQEMTAGVEAEKKNFSWERMTTTIEELAR